MRPMIITLFVFMIVIAVAFVFIFKRMLHKTEKSMTKAAMRQGRKNAFACLVAMVVVVLVIAIAIKLIFDKTLMESFIPAFGALYLLIFIAFYVSWFRGISKKGSLVLDCGGHPAKGTFLFQAAMWSFFTTMLVVAGFVAYFTDRDTLQDSLFYLLFVFPTAVYWFIMAYGRLQILENGIWQYVGLLNWNKIVSYEWQGEENRTLMLTVNSKFPSLGKGALPVPLEHRDAVDALLQKYVSMSQKSAVSSDKTIEE